MSDLPKTLDSALRESYPNPAYPSCIIWADDIIILSETEDGLRKILKSMEEYCKENELTLNTEKNKCMIFNKGGHLLRKHFQFNDTMLETVRSYKF